MAIKFSKEQQLAIDSSKQNIVVSAGAGSGKTAVLTERIRRILKSGVKADEILVLTFTNLAAKEMKERILKAMAKDESLAHRISEVDGAYITTFDSFSLSFVKKYHDRLNLSKNISIVDNSVLNVYKRQILDDIFDSYYQTLPSDFCKFLNDLTEKDDVSIKSQILNIANKLDLKTNRDHYLSTYISSYFNNETIDKYIAELLSILHSYIDEMKRSLAILKEEIDEKKYEKIAGTYCLLLNSISYNDIKNNSDISSPKMGNFTHKHLKKEKGGDDNGN